MAASLCTLTLNSTGTAVSEGVKYEALPDQIIDGDAVDCTPVVATAAGKAYTASLVRKARYRILSKRFPFSQQVITIPDTATANLGDILFNIARG